MRRRDFLGTLASTAVQHQSAPRPNILLILADDLGYGDLGCFGQRMFATPNIDRLASGGMRFTQAYAGASVCAPSRCCLMTGLHTGHARIRGNHGRSGERISLRSTDVTVARVLKQAGYRTACVGKWGIGEAGTEGVPNRQGFDEWYGFLNQDHALEYFPTHIWQNERETFPGGNQGAKRKEYVQDLFTNRSLEFIDEQGKQPFFLYLPFTLPHAQSELGRDTGNGFPVPDFGPYGDRPWPDPEKGFAATMSHLDASVGKIMGALQRKGLVRNTLVVFTSDNGPALDGGHSPEFFGSAGPLRGRKGSLLEGGIRVPTILHWPGVVPAGEVSEEPWAFCDFLPTAADLSGAGRSVGLDGQSIVPLLRGGKWGERRFFYWEQAGSGGLQQAVRIGNWKAIRSPRGTTAIYDLLNDPGEAKDVAPSQPGIAREAEELFRREHVDSEDYSVAGN